MKNLVKRLFLIILIAGVIAGGYVLVANLINNEQKSTTKIVEASQDYDFNEKYKKSYEGLQMYAGSLSASSEIKYVNDMNDFLLEYYNHYLTLTQFVNKSNSTKVNQILAQLKTLSEKVALTTENLRITGAPEIATNLQERERRFNRTKSLYFEQTNTFFGLTGLLKEYVFETNYESQKTGVTLEVQMEIVRDYAKLTFESEIYKKTEESSEEMCVDFSRLLLKFNNRQTAGKNGDKETKVVLTYLNITRSILKEFYTHVSDRLEYINNVSDVSQRLSLSFLYDYITQEAI